MEDSSYKAILNTFFGRKDSGVSKKVPKKKNWKKYKWLPLIGIFACVFLAASIAAGIYVKKSRPAKGAAQPVKVSRSEDILRGGKLNYTRLEKVYFEGDAKEESALLGLSVKLVNSGNGALVIAFREPVDFTGKYLFLTAKTVGGIKSMKVVLLDAANHACETPGRSFKAEWDSKYIALRKRGKFDLEAVKVLKFIPENTGGKNSENPPIYIKDIILTGPGPESG